MGVSVLMGRSVRVVLLLLAGVVALLAAGAAGAIAADRFGDVSASGTHTPGIIFVADAGVTGGCGGGDYCPSDNVTRGQMATFLHRLSGNAPGVAPSVNAATVGGLSAEALMSGAGDPAVVQALIDRVEELEALLEGVSRQQVGGRDTLRFEGVNVQVVNGTGSTSGTPNGTGNLIVGYDAAFGGVRNRSGSHYVVVGDEHQYTRFGGIVAGFQNTASGDWASVTGGHFHTASGEAASVSGGAGNRASGVGSSVSGGAGGQATAEWASVSGGDFNTASGRWSSVSGGRVNTAGASTASILGGSNRTVSTNSACHPACS